VSIPRKIISLKILDFNTWRMILFKDHKNIQERVYIKLKSVFERFS